MSKADREFEGKKLLILGVFLTWFTGEIYINYQKFYDLCDENDKKKLDEIIKKGGNEILSFYFS